MDRPLVAATVLAAILVSGGIVRGEDVARLRLVPFPKKVAFQGQAFDLKQCRIIEVPDQPEEFAGTLVIAELQRAGLPAPHVVVQTGNTTLLRLTTGSTPLVLGTQFREGAGPENYQLAIEPNAITCRGQGPAGLFHAVQTLCQLIRANREGTKLPGLAVEDWPSLRWRCLQADLTRGPSVTLPALKRDIELGSLFKHNLWTYYMEYQYAFKKHPKIGPKDGSLEPDDLKALVGHARRYQMEVLGNQQSFGHFGWILRHKEYASLAETGDVLCPIKEESYKLLDDLYSEVCPILPFEMFNVCCDETFGLGQGPSRDLARQVGVGGVYVQHLRRVHDLLKDRYGKRMMMWGDIILQHPDQLDRIPRDTVMLTWAYDARASFENQILPFKKSGFEFFVCPGISNWSRILPDFGTATTNIHNFVRDGIKQGALGMLNTDWEDDGEALQGYRWHGHAWGGECAWNGSATNPEDFNRRIGAVLFGEKNQHFGEAIALLSRAHRLPGMQGMENRRFWENDFAPVRGKPVNKDLAERLLKIVRPAIVHLDACKHEATVNADLLDAFLLGARRMELIGTRMLDGLQAADLYTQACKREPRLAGPLLEQVEKLVRTNREKHEAQGREFARLWLADCKPYALDWTMKRYAATAAWYDGLLARLGEARKAAAADTALLPPEKVGLVRL